MIKAIFFDVDDTLLNFNASANYAYKKMLEEHHIPYYPNVEAYYHEVNKQLWQILDHGKITRDELLVKRFKIVFKEYDAQKLNQSFLTYLSDSAYVNPNTIETLSTLYKKYPLYAASNSQYDLQLKRLKLANISKYFTDIYCSSSIGFTKPDIRFYQKCIEKTNIDPSEILMVGDNIITDIEGAKKAGLQTCLYDPNKLDHDLTYCDHVIYDLIELIKY